MSEEILKALTQLFAIITKQDEGVTDVERQFVEQFFKQRLNTEAVKEYLALYEEFLVDKRKERKPRRARPESKEGKDPEEKSQRRAKLTSMKDSVRTLAICKKINKTLTQQQKVIVLMEILELVNSDKNFTSQRRDILNTISTVFNIEASEYEVIEKFITSERIDEINHPEILICSHDEPEGDNQRYIHSDHLNGYIALLHVASVDLYFVIYHGEDEITLNSLPMRYNRVYLYSSGSSLKPAKGAPVYYSDVVAHYSSDKDIPNVSFNAKGLNFKFPNGAIGLRDVNISQNRGSLIGIMGASGAGKTTLLNVLAGIEAPSEGEVLINGINLHARSNETKGVIGYISQDDILIEDLSVFENLYYNAKLCFSNKTESELQDNVTKTLENLGLNHIRDLKVGNVLNKKISGGQRKRLNIALELIREPAVMFVDEPTSGLSSRDSENVIDLLKELSLKGKMIFVVIHQPSSDIYKKFDSMFIMDTGGYPIFSGSPVDAITYFKKSSNQINADKGQCSECGNVNPEQIFDIVEAQVVNEYGQETGKRKVTPTEWSGLYSENFQIEHSKDFEEQPPNSLSIPNKLKQWFIYTARDIKSKISNKQYLFINLLEAPVLALLLAILIRYTNAPDDSGYHFRYNENFPAYILMSIVVALFMGLTVSAEEIIKDRKILKRERFLNLSRSSYLMSKIGILFLLSAVQTLSFVVIGNSILGIPHMYWPFWIVLFSVSCFANVLGLNISSSFNSAVTVYIVIPLLLIPQMVLSGALFNFEKLHDFVSTKGSTPLVADVMASRWAYEALAVEQFKDGAYQKYFYQADMDISRSNYVPAYLIPELRNLLSDCEVNVKKGQNLDQIPHDFLIVKSEVKLLHDNHPDFKLDQSALEGDYTDAKDASIRIFLREIELTYNINTASLKKKKDFITAALETSLQEQEMSVALLKDMSYNERLEEIVRNVNTDQRVARHGDQLVQQIDPIYHVPKPDNILDYRAQFFAPQKHFAGIFVQTFTFNMLVIWAMSLLLFTLLYFDVFKKTIDLFERLKFNKSEF